MSSVTILYELYRKAIGLVGDQKALVITAQFLANEVDARVKKLYKGKRNVSQSEIESVIQDVNKLWVELCNYDDTLNRDGFLEFMEDYTKIRLDHAKKKNKSIVATADEGGASVAAESIQTDAGK